MRERNWNIGLAPRSTFHRSVDDFFNDRYRYLLGMDEEFTPAINTREATENYQVELAVPGYDKDDLRISVQNGILTISSEKKETAEKKNAGDNYLRREFSYRAFTRRFPLPADVDEEHIQAEYKDGILRIFLPRQEKEEEKETARRIPILQD